MASVPVAENGCEGLSTCCHAATSIGDDCIPYCKSCYSSLAYVPDISKELSTSIVEWVKGIISYETLKAIQIEHSF